MIGLNRRRGLMDAGAGVSILPAGYLLLDYIRTNIENPEGILIDIQLPFGVVLTITPITALQGGSNYDCFFGCNSNMQLAMNTGLRASNGRSATSAPMFTLGKETIIDANIATTENDTFYKVDGIDTGLKRTSNVSRWGVLCASLQNAQNYKKQYCANAKIHSLKIYKSGELYMDMYPCKRKADVKNGLYDVVNGIFYESNMLSE